MSKSIDTKILFCPVCKSSEFSVTPEYLVCSACNSLFPAKKGKYFFASLNKEDIKDSLDGFKFYLKKYSFLYQLLIQILSPVCPTLLIHKFLKQNITSKEGVYINFGSGNSNLSPLVSNVDIFAYPHVDMTCNITQIPIQNNSVDCIINIAVLEHIPYPEKAVKEFHRILKDKGKILCLFPFIQGFHASPYDYSRRTYEGIKILFQDYEIESIALSGGPTSGMLWILQNWLAMIFSFGSSHFYRFFCLFFMLLSFPLKFLDILLVHHPCAKDICSSFAVVARKKRI